MTKFHLKRNVAYFIKSASYACHKKWRNSHYMRWRRKRSNLRILKTMRRLLAENTTKLGRKTRRHFDSVDSKVAILKGLVIVGSALIMIGILFWPVKTVFVTHNLWIRIALTIVSLALGFVFLRILGKERNTVNRSRLPETIGPIGKVMKSFLTVTNKYIPRSRNSIKACILPILIILRTVIIGQTRSSAGS